MEKPKLSSGMQIVKESWGIGDILKPKLILLCINDKGVFNIKQGKTYESNGEIIHNEKIRNICIVNDMEEVGYYNLDRFKIV
ncbi:MAG: hypothetical protein ACRDDY_03630 [Clostridium sp.]|uniref:hypothetical protein n=1 Tax=Clostridium sp. TaxID=1506 RepID=UPI003EE58DCF